MKTTLWRSACACALLTSLFTTPQAASAARKAKPTLAARSGAVAAFEQRLHHAVAVDDTGAGDPFADDPYSDGGSGAHAGPPGHMMQPNGGTMINDWAGAGCATCSDGGCSTGGLGMNRQPVDCNLFQSHCDDNWTWVRADYLMWWTQGQSLPPLVTSSPAGTAQADAGELPDATILFGDERVDDGLRSGGRIEVGMFLDSCRDWGLTGRFFALGGGDVGFSRGSDDGSDIIGRPFINANSGAETASLVSFPGLVAGNVAVSTESDLLVSEIFVRRSLLSQTRFGRVDLLGGYYFSRIDESLEINTDQTALGGGGVPAGTEIGITDGFAVENEFHGGQIGLMAERTCGMWSMRLLGKVALGNMAQRVRIYGDTTNTFAGPSAGGLLAQPTNIGEFDRDRFAVVPELDFTLAYQISKHLEASIGYTFIYWSDVVRPGDVVDRTVNLTQAGGNPLVGPARPDFDFASSDFWAQGVNLGLTYEF